MLESEKKKFDKDELVVREDIHEGNRLFSAFQSAGFIHKMIEGKFEIIDFIEAPTDTSFPTQDSWLLRKIE